MATLNRRIVCRKCGASITRRGKNRHSGSRVCETRAQEIRLERKGWQVVAPIETDYGQRVDLKRTLRSIGLTTELLTLDGFIRDGEYKFRVRKRTWAQREWVMIARWVAEADPGLSIFSFLAPAAPEPIHEPSEERYADRLAEARGVLFHERNGDLAPRSRLVALIALGA